MKKLLARYGLLPAMDQETEYVGDLAEIANIGRGKSVVLCGQLVFASLTGAHPGRGFIRQYSRRSAKRRLTLRKFPEIHLFAEEEALRGVDAQRGRILFAVDHYLTWGLAQRGSVIVIGGYPSADSTSLQLYIISNGQLRTIQEKNLPAYDNPRFPSELAFFLEETRATFASYKIYWAAPLPPLDSEYLKSDIVNIGAQPFARHIYMPVLKREGSAPLMHVAGLPLLIWGPLCLAYAGLMWAPYHHYHRAKKEYETRTDPAINPQTCQPSNYPDYLYRSQTNKLEVIQLQKAYLYQPMPQVMGASALKQKLEAIASIPQLTIKAFNLDFAAAANAAASVPGGAAPGTPANAPAGAVSVAPPAAAVTVADHGNNAIVSFTVSVPRKADMKALDQGNELLKELTRRMGMNLHLMPQGWQELPDGKGGTHIYRIEG